jgi:hypothetical protein
MGYLDNSSITVDAILTKKGRELLARNDGSFNITSFALGDDEIDYSLFNENHPNGSQYSGEAIENMPILEAFPDENNIMRHKLVTLPRNTTQLPMIELPTNKVTLNRNGVYSLQPNTLYYNGNNTQENYKFTVKDARILPNFGAEINGNSSTSQYASGVAFSETVSNLNNLTIKALNSISLFGSNTSLITTVTIEGMDTGARTTLIVQVNKVDTNNETGEYNQGTAN